MKLRLRTQYSLRRLMIAVAAFSLLLCAGLALNQMSAEAVNLLEFLLVLIAIPSIFLIAFKYVRYATPIRPSSSARNRQPSEIQTIPPRKSLARRLARRFLGAIFATLALLAFGPMALLVVIGATRQGRLFGGVALGLFVASVALVILFWRVPANVRPWWLTVGMALLVSLGLGVLLIRATPVIRPERSTGLVARSVGPARVPRYSPANLLPEIDQVKLVVSLATRVVPWSVRARTIREVTMNFYHDIEADPEARGLGPVTHFAALELLGANFESGHSFAYVPRARPGEKLGMVVFLHGNAGNFQALPWAWRSFAEEHRMVILCPTFGFGFWGEGGVEAVERARDDAVEQWGIDPGRVYLAGLSDGGVGVTRTALAHPDRYRGLIFISPTMKLDELGRASFARAWLGRRVFVAQGDRDRNVLKDTVDPAVDLLKRQGVVVDYQVFAGEDHFLFFSKSRELFAAIGEWMVKIDRPLVSEKAGHP